MSVNPEDAGLQAKSKTLCLTCHYFGKNHDKLTNNCPAFGKVCMACKKNNNFSSMCKISGAS